MTTGKKTLRAAAILSLMFGVCAVREARADEARTGQDYQVYELGEIVVQGERAAASRDVTLARSVGAEEIEAAGAKELPQALRMLPGLNISATGRKNTGSARFVGFSHAQTTFLIDGVPYYEPYQNDTNLNAFPTDMIARIDAIRGTPSVLYGPGGLGGIINVITKQATDEPTFSAYAELGDYSTWNLGATHGNKVGDFRYWVNARYHTSDGWPLSRDFSPHEGRIGQGNRANPFRYAVLQDKGGRDNAAQEGAGIWAKAGYEPNQNSAYYLTGFYNHSSWDDPWSTRSVPQYFSQDRAGGAGAFTAFDRINNYDDWGVDFDGKQRLTDTLLARLKLFYHGHKDDYESFGFDESTRTLFRTARDGTSYWDISTYQDKVFGGSTFLDWDLHEKDTLRFAAHYKKDIHEQRDAKWLEFSEASAFTGSLAVENEWRPVDGLGVVAGVAYNWYKVDSVDDGLLERGRRHPWGPGSFDKPKSMDSVDPMLGVTYTFADATRLYGSFSRRSNFPSLKDMFNSTNGNPGLKPEHSTNFVVGVERPFLDDTLLIDLSGFHNRIKDRINGSRFAPSGTLPNINYGDVRIFGLETAVTWKPIDDFSLRLGYTFAYGTNHEDDRLTDDVPDVPKHKLTAHLQYSVPNWRTRFDLSGMIVSDKYDSVPTQRNPDDPKTRLSGYSLVNLRVSQPIGDHWEIYALGKNLFDSDYEEQYGWPGHGREFFVGVKTNF